MGYLCVRIDPGDGSFVFILTENTYETCVETNPFPAGCTDSLRFSFRSDRFRTDSSSTCSYGHFLHRASCSGMRWRCITMIEFNQINYLIRLGLGRRVSRDRQSRKLQCRRDRAPCQESRIEGIPHQCETPRRILYVAFPHDRLQYLPFSLAQRKRRL